MSKPAIDEKKLERLRSQLFGKTPSQQKQTNLETVKENKLPHSYKIQYSANPLANLSDTAYLKKDLIKIAILTTLALLIQFSLYFGINHNLIKLPI